MWLLFEVNRSLSKKEKLGSENHKEIKTKGRGCLQEKQCQDRVEKPWLGEKAELENNKARLGKPGDVGLTTALKFLTSTTILFNLQLPLSMAFPPNRKSKYSR